MPLLVLLAPFLAILVFGVLIGGINERRHLKSLERREAELARIRVNNLRHPPSAGQRPRLVLGQVVIATDMFKSIAAKLRNLVGGEIKSADRLMQRGRREALLRLKEEARALGANEVWNVRFGFANISMMRGKQGAIQIEVLASGTAVARSAQA